MGSIPTTTGEGPLRTAIKGSGRTAWGVPNADERREVALLLVAAMVVGVAIALDGSAAKAANGVGGALWLTAGGMLVRKGWRLGLTSGSAAMVGATVLLLSSALSPRDLLAASLGFVAGGLLLGAVTRPRPARTAAVALLPALWLPTHLLVAITKAGIRELAGREASLRTDPPPTAALVPLAMVVAALVGGAAGIALVERRAVGRGAGQTGG